MSISTFCLHRAHLYVLAIFLNPELSFYLFESPVDRALGNLHGRCLRLVCPARKLVIALAALPDTCTPALDRLHVTFRAAVEGSGDSFNISHSLAYKSSVPATKASGTTCYFSFCFMSRACHYGYPPICLLLFVLVTNILD